MNPEISNEQLNAFIDGELDIPEKDSLFVMLETDPDLAHQICELRAVKELVRHGYAEQRPSAQRDWVRKFYVPQSLVAGVMLILGLTMGWLGRDLDRPAAAMPLAQFQPRLQAGALRPVSLAAVTQDMNKIVMHVDSANAARFGMLLDDVEYLTEHQMVNGHPVQIEVLASHKGLSMLRADVTPYAARIKALVKRHPNVTFVACNQTIQQLTRDGVKVRLVPHTLVAPAATEEIVARLRGGWTYIKV
ncbi:MAG: hypothetical protein P4L77_07220 [Sulfuriferula sp.]|nr:hypothetical protein [Sulfuriferula sp.]